MKRAELIAHGIDDAAAQRLQALLRDRGVAVRVTRQAKACVNLMRQGAVGVLLLRVGKDLESEFALLAQTAQQFPRMAPVVWADSDHPQLAGLAWDLGARGVVTSLHDRDQVHDLVLRLLPE